MAEHFTLTQEEFEKNKDLFHILEIEKDEEVKKVVGKNYQELSEFLKERHHKLVREHHPDRGGDENRFDQIHKACQELKKYIGPLESGNPCVKVSIDAESDGRLTARELHYRKKLFDKLDIGEEAIGKDFKELDSILSKKCSGFLLNRNDNARVFLQSRELYNYISPLQKRENIIKKDKEVLVQKFIERKDTLLSFKNWIFQSLSILNIITIGCYLSWWIIAFSIVTNIVVKKLIDHYTTKYKGSEISTDEFMRKISYIQLGYKLLLIYPLAAFSVYLLATNFIANGLTVGGVILGPLLALAIVIEILAPIFSKGCEIYAEKHTKDLLEEDTKDRVEKATDLLHSYNPLKLLMPIFMPLVKKCFAEVARELAERNLDEVNTDMSDVEPKQPKADEVNTDMSDVEPKQPKAIEFTQQDITGTA